MCTIRYFQSIKIGWLAFRLCEQFHSYVHNTTGAMAVCVCLCASTFSIHAVVLYGVEELGIFFLGFGVSEGVGSLCSPFSPCTFECLFNGFHLARWLSVLLLCVGVAVAPFAFAIRGL